MALYKTYLPTREADFLDWCKSLHRNLAADPVSFGTTAERVTEYNTTLTRFAEAYVAATDPATRTRPMIERKTETKMTLVRSTQSIVRQIQARPETTDEQRRLLNITVADRRPTPHIAPTEMPDMTMTKAISHTMELQIRRPDGGRGRPPGTLGANVYYAVSPSVPTLQTGWTHAGQATRMTTQITLPLSTPPGATVWIAACYYNGRGENGPLSDAITTNLPGGQARLAA